MSEQVFYRKYRPQSFKDVLGQEHIIKALSSSIENDRISHAYLFSGSRGTGKTSLARILAREIGCTDTDLYELDAASNTGVGDIRELCEGARTLPFESPKKVYIIDEVHMLSKSAFNAFLKTLEEPPAHTVFILATTELRKVPDTVISRCQLFNFNKPNEEILGKMIADLARKEGFKIEQDAVNLLAILGDGSFRDTQVVLQQVVGSVNDKNISLETVEEITGAPSVTVSHELIGYMLAGDSDLAFTLLSEVVAKNSDVKTLMKILMSDLRKILFLKYAPDLFVKMEVSPREKKFFQEMSTHQNSKLLSAILREFLESYSQLGKTHINSLPLELAVSRVFEMSVA